MKISIIICAYNEEEKISRCIDSVRTQTYSNWELWVVDDGSTDNTAEIVKKYEATDERIHLYSQENQGLSSARKSGIRCATGEYLTFIDADDYVGELYLEHLLEGIHHFPEVECVHGGYFLYKDGKISNFSNLEKLFASKKTLSPPIEAVETSFHRIALWAKLWKLTFLKQHIAYIPDHVNKEEDTITNFVLYPFLKHICFVPHADYHYSIHPKSITYARYSAEAYVQTTRMIINAINQAYWKESNFAYNSQFFFLLITLQAVVDSSLSTHQSICLLQQLPTPLLSKRFFRRSLGYGKFIFTWLLKHKHYRTLLTLTKLRFKILSPLKQSLLSAIKALNPNRS